MKRKITLCILAIVITILICIGITYAYFSANVALNNQTETVIKSNELTLTFNGTSEINCSNLIPGESCTKTFNVKNESNRAVTYNIYMQNITNEFNEDLVYTLTDETGVVVAETKAPDTNTEKAYILSDIEIGATSTKNYTLKVEFKYLTTPQNDNQGASFKATVGIDSNKVIIEENAWVIENDEDNSGNINIGDSVCYGEECFYIVKIENNNYGLLSKYNLDKNELIQLNGTSWSDTAVKFSSENYWLSSATGDIYDINDLSLTVNIDNIIKTASSYAQKFGVTGRLLTYSEANELVQIVPEVMFGSYSNVGYINYWLGSAGKTYYDTDIWTFYSQAQDKSNPYYENNYQNGSLCGIRPIIFVPIDAISLN